MKNGLEDKSKEDLKNTGNQGRCFGPGGSLEGGICSRHIGLVLASGKSVSICTWQPIHWSDGHCEQVWFWVFVFFVFNQCSTGKYYFLTRDSKQQTLFSIFLKYHTTTQKEEGNIYNLYGFCKRASTQPLLYIAKLRNCVQCEPFTVCGYKEPIIWPLVSP